MRKPRPNHSAAFKALETIRVEKTVAEIAAHHEVHHATQVTAWKSQLLEKAAGIFGENAFAADGRTDPPVAREDRRADGRERCFRRHARGFLRPERQAMIDRGA
jgi:transposase-like protein